MEEPDILLDELTNHLDLEAIEWLEDYPNSHRGIPYAYPATRRFWPLLRTAFWLDRGRLVSPRGFKYFEECSQLRHWRKKSASLKPHKQAVGLEVWASCGVKARKRNVRRPEMEQT